MFRAARIGKYFLPGLAAIVAIILIDQFTKWYVVENLLRIQNPGAISFGAWLVTIPETAPHLTSVQDFKNIVLAPFLNLVMVWNQGVSFGIAASDASFMPLVFIGLSLAISLFMLVWLALSVVRWQAVALTFVIGGALGNIMDRIRFGAVADFIDFHVAKYHWPAFNVADSSIVLGAGILLVGTLFFEEETEK